jgi:hypothetical protein
VNGRDHAAYLAAIKDGRVSTMKTEEVSIPAVVIAKAAKAPKPVPSAKGKAKGSSRK